MTADIDTTAVRPGARALAAAVLVLVSGAACANSEANADEILRAGACQRHHTLFEAVRAMQPSRTSSEARDTALTFHHGRVSEAASLSPELQASRYGDELAGLRADILLALEAENVRPDGTDWPDWPSLLARVDGLAVAWGCDTDGAPN